MKIRALLALSYLATAPAFADSTINNLSAGTALAGTEQIPMYQGANPAVTTTPNALLAFVNSYATKSASYTLALPNQWQTQILSTGGVITIPTNASVAFQINASIPCLITDTNPWTVTGAVGVTVNGVSAGSATIVGVIGTKVWLTKVATNIWTVR